MSLFKLLEQHVRHGTLNVYLPDGSTCQFGGGSPQASIRFHDTAPLRRIARDPSFEFGETYMDGGWTPGEEGLRALLHVAMANFAELLGQRGRAPLTFLQKLIQQRSRVRRSYRNVSHHYDLDEWLFRRFLDHEMLYSCAYFERPGMSLEDAQRAKCRIIGRKLCLAVCRT